MLVDQNGVEQGSRSSATSPVRAASFTYSPPAASRSLPLPSPPERQDLWQRGPAGLGHVSWANLTQPHPSSPMAPLFAPRRGSVPELDSSWQSSAFYKTHLLANESPRAYYLAHPEAALRPFVSCSPFVPAALVTHLLRNKPTEAGKEGDATQLTKPETIGPMEALYHAFVTPVAHAKLHGDCSWHGQAGGDAASFVVRPFACEGGLQQARMVVLSGQVPLDYSHARGMVAAASLGEDPFVGQAWTTEDQVPAGVQRAQPQAMAAYAAKLRGHLVHSLTQAHRLPALAEVADQALDEATLTRRLEQVVLTEDEVVQPFVGSYLRLAGGQILATEMLLRAAIEQVCNELSLLEEIVPQGYVYTYELPLHATGLVGAALLTRIHCAALKCAVQRFGLASLKIYAFDSQGERGVMNLLHEAVADQKLKALVTSKADLFDGVNDSYRPFLGTHDKLLVLHTHASPTHQATETESCGLGREGALAEYSSFAASLARDNPQLLRQVYSPGSRGAEVRREFLGRH